MKKDTKDIHINLGNQNNSDKVEDKITNETAGELTKNVGVDGVNTDELSKEEIEALAASKAVELRENDKKLLEDQKEEEEREEKAKKFRKVLTIIIVILFILLLMARCSVQSITPIFRDKIDKGYADTTDIGSVVDEQEDDDYDSRYSMLTISMNKSPSFENGRAEGTLNIENDPNNVYNQYVDIYLRDENDNPTTLIYSSDLIPIGQVLPKDTLDVNLPAGSYKAIAYFNAVTVDTRMKAGQAAALIDITIKNTVE